MRGQLVRGVDHGVDHGMDHHVDRRVGWVPIVLLAASCQGELPVCLHDAFDGTSIDRTRWTLMDASHTDVAVRDGHLVIALPAATNTNDGIRSVASYDLTGGSVEVHVARYLTPSVNSQSELAVMLDAQRGFFLGTTYQMFIFRSSVAGSDTTLPFDAAIQDFRLRHDPAGDRMLFETRAAGAGWVARRSEPRSFPITSMTVQLEADSFNGGVAEPGVVEFDDIVVAGPGCGDDPHEIGPQAP